MRLFIIIKILLFSVALKAQVLPDAPVFLSASIIPESDPMQIELSWLASDSLNVEGYYIYKVNGLTVSYDTVYGRLNTSYVFEVSGALNETYSFRICSFDDDDNKSLLTGTHTTIRMSLSLDKCNDYVDLSWSNYSGWSDGVSKYNIYRRTPTSSYLKVGEVSGDKSSYVDINTETEAEYYYYVQAENYLGYKANSNSLYVYTDTYDPPSYVYAQSASVISDNINLRFRVDNTAEVLEYRLQKSTSVNGQYQTIRSFPNIGQTEVTYIDTEVNVDEVIYYYRLVSLNPCGVISSTSNLASNIIITADESEDLDHYFSWTEYFDWQDGVLEYRIYSSFDNTDNHIGTVYSDEFSSQHNIESYVNYCHDNQLHLTNRFCYYIEAIEDHADNPTGVRGVSRSNKVCFMMEPVVYFPNAINTSSYSAENREFRPVLSFIEKEPFEMIIMDRAGFEIYRTTKTYEGWDGLLQYSIAPSQQYMFVITYYDYTGKMYQKIGKFNLFNF
jgi:hypothetical protein